jgi:hypothetical protein
MNVLQELMHLYSRRRFACLFFSLLSTLVAAPVLVALGLGTNSMDAFLALNILASILITLVSFRSYVGLGLLVLATSLRVGYALLGYEPLLMTSQGINVVICLVATLVMLRFMLSTGTVNSERIFAALSAYLMIGLICGLLFFIFEEEWPGSFSFQGFASSGSGSVQLADTIYFSFVTLGTLGYGDITPIGGPVRALAVAEAIGGQMYLAVLVARLVSLYRDLSDLGERDRQEH